MIFLFIFIVLPCYKEIQLIKYIYMKIISNIEKIQELDKKYKFDTII